MSELFPIDRVGDLPPSTIATDPREVSPDPSSGNEPNGPPLRAARHRERGWTHRLGAHPLWWLLLLVGVWCAAVVALGELRVLDLTTSTWDMGIYQQALWSAGHGRGFYESPDWETGGFSSFLQVHSAFILYLLVPVYGLFPSQTTLLIAQAVVVGGAAFPLYFLAKDVTGSPKAAMAAAGLYLVWTPILGGALYDFHAEAFLPIEYFTLVLFWNRGRYHLGALVALLAFLTFDIAPVLIGVFALVSMLPSRWPLPSAWSSLRAVVRDLVRYARRPPVLSSFVLLLSSIAAYGILLAVRTTWLSSAIGLGPVPPLNRGYVIGATPSQLGLSLSYLGIGLVPKLGYWLILYALLLFVPLLAPRYFLLPLPWIAYTLLSYNLNYTTLGFQYGFLVAGPIFVGLLYGGVRLRTLRAVLREMAARTRAPRAVSGRRSGGSRARWALPSRSLVVLALLLVANLLLSPADPMVQHQIGGSAYRITYQVPPGWADVQHLAQLVPTSANVLASDDLFPLVANSEHAWSLLWAQDPTLALPFGPQHPPDDVLISAAKTSACPTWLVLELQDSSQFGVRGIVWTTPDGPVLLYQHHYSGSSSVWGAPPVVSGTYSGTALGPGPEAAIIPDPTSPTGSSVQELGGNEGLLFSSPDAAFPAGHYLVTFWARGSSVPNVTSPTASSDVLELNANGFPWPIEYSASLTYATFSSGGWLPFSFYVNLTGPALDWSLRGYVTTTQVELGLAQIQIQSVPVAP